jgi:hypothetical protein
MSEESSWYVRACKTTVRKWGWTVRDPVAFSRQCEKSVSSEYRDALIFTGLTWKPSKQCCFLMWELLQF